MTKLLVGYTPMGEQAPVLVPVIIPDVLMRAGEQAAENADGDKYLSWVLMHRCNTVDEVLSDAVPALVTTFEKQFSELIIASDVFFVEWRTRPEFLVDDDIERAFAACHSASATANEKCRYTVQLRSRLVVYGRKPADYSLLGVQPAGAAVPTAQP